MSNAVWLSASPVTSAQESNGATTGDFRTHDGIQLPPILLAIRSHQHLLEHGTRLGVCPSCSFEILDVVKLHSRVRLLQRSRQHGLLGRWLPRSLSLPFFLSFSLLLPTPRGPIRVYAPLGPGRAVSRVAPGLPILCVGHGHNGSIGRRDGISWAQRDRGP